MHVSVTRSLWMALPIVIALIPNGRGVTQPAPAQQGDPKACSDQERLRLDGQNSPRDPSRQDLSEKLDKTEGVLCPPNVDPAIKAPTPDAGKMPVIPPPGAPGGDPNVRPK